MRINLFVLAAVLLAVTAVSFPQAPPPYRYESIRKVDFRNFNYGPLCPGTHKFLALTSTRLDLRNGHQEHGDSANYADLGSVTYVDLDGDGRDEAFVVIKGQTSGSSNGYVSAYVFALKVGSATQLWSKCEENSTAKLKGRTVIFTSPQWLANDAHCCFSYVSTATYGWKGKGLALLSTTRKKSDAGAPAENGTVDDLARRFAEAFTGRSLVAFDAAKPYRGRVTMVVEHSITGRTDMRGFTTLKTAAQWLMRSRKEANLNAGGLERCKNGTCTYADEGLLHNSLYLKKVTYGITKGRAYLKSVFFLDGD